MKKEMMFLIPMLFILCSCGSSSPSSSSSSTSSSSSIHQYEGKSYTVSTDDWSFTAGTNFDNEGNINNLKNHFNTKGGEDSGLISKIECSSIVSQAWGDDSKRTSLCLGSSKADGVLTFTFAKPIQSVKFGCETYWKTYEYPAGTKNKSIDTTSVFETKINSNSMGKSTLLIWEEEAVLLEKECSDSEPGYSLSIIGEGYQSTTKSSRVIFHYFTFVY